MGNDAPSSMVSHMLYPVPQHLKPGLLQKLLDNMNVDSVLVLPGPSTARTVSQKK